METSVGADGQINELQAAVYKRTSQIARRANRATAKMEPHHVPYKVQGRQDPIASRALCALGASESVRG